MHSLRSWISLVLLSCFLSVFAEARALFPSEQLLPTETADIENIRLGILGIQAATAAPGGKLLRGTHSKGVCMGASFEVFDIKSMPYPEDLKQKLAQSLYAQPGKYQAVVRFANAASGIFDDEKADVRAFSFWIDLPAGKFGPNPQRQDFSMNNATTFPLNDAHEFATLMKFIAAGKNPLALSFSDNAVMAKVAVRAYKQEHQDIQPFQKMRYWSTVPFQHGASDVVKYSATPCGSNSASPIVSSDPNGLLDEVKRHVENDPNMSCFDFGLQILDASKLRSGVENLYSHEPASFWVENAAVEWDENEIPFVTVGRITLNPKSVLPQEDCERSSVDVNGNSLPQQIGLGSINRARRPAENASKAKRLQSAEANDPKPVTYLDQGWDYASRQTFYFSPQGSHIMPYAFAKNLENADDQSPFLTSENLAKFGYIPQNKSAENPDGLPVGFTMDGTSAKPELGINCASCHTEQISFKGKAIRIDGGPAMADFQGFVKDLDRSIFALVQDTDKFERFAGKMFPNGGSAADRSNLKTELDALVVERRAWQERNATSAQYGHGRNDAFGIIFNQVLAGDLNMPANRRDPDAPVSYPVLWDTPYHDIVQWIGIVQTNRDPLGPLSRNIGQVLGVFGSLETQRDTIALDGHCTTAKRDNLEKLEGTIRTLWAPKWPEEILGKIDTSKASLGKIVYEGKGKCVQCHSEVSTQDPSRELNVHMIPVEIVKTDGKVAFNAATRTAETGSFEGKRIALKSGRKLEAVEPASLVLRHAVAGAMAGTISFLTCKGDLETSSATIKESWKKVADQFFKNLPQKTDDEPAGSLDSRMAQSKASLMKYKARPLDGIWASAPYLHNGSVKNLYEMLLPAAKRSPRFRLGCQEFDPEHVGFECDNLADTAAGAAPLSEFDSALDGNSNAGHEFAAALSEEERMNLLEYLKTL